MKFSPKFARVALVALVAAPVLAMADTPAIDMTAATAGITAGQTALTTLWTGLITAGAAVWGLRLVARFFKLR